MKEKRRKTSMLKKIIIGFVSIFAVLFVLSKLFPINYFEEGKKYYSEKEYEKAFKYLNQVEENHENYSNALNLIKEIQPIVDSINIVKKQKEQEEEQKRIKAKQEKEKAKQEKQKAKQEKQKAEEKAKQEKDKLIKAELSEEQKEKELLKTEKHAEEENDESIYNKKQLKKEIESIDKGIEIGEGNNIESLQMDIVLFSLWAKLITDAENSKDEETKELGKRLKSKVLKIQVVGFPKLREKYTEIISNKLWENDIDVYSNGSSKKYINFTGGVFARNKNKQDFQNQVNEVLLMFRFKQSRYRWYKGDNEYTYYTIFQGKDSDLVKLK